MTTRPSSACLRDACRLAAMGTRPLPGYVRGSQDTEDLVQDTVVSALKQLNRFEPRHEGALQALPASSARQSHHGHRPQVARRPAQTEMPADLAAQRAISPGTDAGPGKIARYEAALARLRPDDREAIVARLELRYRYEDLAVALGKPSANAARVAVSRAIRRLADEMRHAR